LPLLSHLTSCTPTKPKWFLANSMAAAVSDPDLRRLRTFYLPNLKSLFHCWGRTKLSFHVRGTFVTKLEDYTLSAVDDCLFNIFSVTLHIGGRSSIRNLRMRHGVLTGTHLSWMYFILCIFFGRNLRFHHSLKKVYDTKNVMNPSSKIYLYITEISPHAFAQNVSIMHDYLKEWTTSWNQVPSFTRPPVRCFPHTSPS
jgi:hypothetical protein